MNSNNYKRNRERWEKRGKEKEISIARTSTR